jgi:lipoyl(octanoyl) transferase
MLRLLPFLDADGPTHMASDEALLVSAEQPTLRLYRWTPATVSLGYFQDYHAIHAQLPTAMPIVRRITGGGAIWHDHEVTYCLVFFAGRDGFPARVRDVYPAVHQAILRGLRFHQAQRPETQLALQPHSIGDKRYQHEPRCFASPASDDIIASAGGKVLGSAGRQRDQRVLVHGSLKLASNPWDNDVVSGCGLTAEQAHDVLRDGIAAAFGQSLTEDNWTTSELHTRSELQQQRYGTSDWVKLRQGIRP